MEQVRFGRTGLMVSRVSLGTVELGMDYGIEGTRPSVKDAGRLLNRALDLGVTLIDTARAYGAAEEVMGATIAHRRREYVLASKAVASASIQESIETSLRALRTDVIDVLMLHSATVETIEAGVAAEELAKARAAGKIRFTGASVYGEDAGLAAICSGAFDCVQVAYSALDRRPEATVFPEALRCDVAVQARSVLLKGVLTERRRLLPASMGELVRAADALGSDVTELAYRFAISSTPPQTVLVGTAAVKELEQALAWVAKGPLSAEELARVRAVPMPDAFWLNPGNWPPV